MRVNTVFKIFGIAFPLAGFVYFYVAWRNLDFAFPWFSLSFAVGGLIFVIVGLGVGLSPVLSERKKQALRQSGVTIDAQFVSVEINWKFSINNQHPYYVKAQGVDYLGQSREFRSENIWFNPGAYLSAGQKIKIYLDPNQPKRYYMDISFLQSKS